MLVPKVSSADDVSAYSAALEGRARLWTMIETCQAMLRLDRHMARA